VSARHTARTVAGSAIVALTLAACESPKVAPDVVQGSIETAMREAAAPRARVAPPETVSAALLPPLTLEMPSATRPVEARFDLVVSNAPAQQVFMALVAGTRYSIIVHPDVKESLSVNLKDVTLTEALEAIREVYGYEYRIQGTRIYIEPVAMQTRIFQVNYLAARRSGRADVRISSGSILQARAGGDAGGGAAPTPGAAAPGTPSPPGTPGAGTPSQGLESSRVTTSSENDFWTDVQTAIRTLIGTEGGRSAVANPNAGVILVRAMPKELRVVEQYLKAMSGVVERQVMLEAKIIEVTLNDRNASGVNWAAFRQGDNTRVIGGPIAPGTTLARDGALVTPGLAADPAGRVLVTPGATGISAITAATAAAVMGPLGVPGALFGIALQARNFAALLQFLESQGTVHVLSSPRIAALNNQKAVIKVGSDEFFVTSLSTTVVPSTVAGVASTVSPTITTQPFFSGIALDVTPQISDDDQITLHIHPSVSAVTDRVKVLDLGALGVFQLPLASSNINESDTVVRLQDGAIAAIGGLMRQQQTNIRSGLPGTTDRPAGVLAGSRDQTVTKSELVILLKVSIIRGDAAWQQQAQELNDRMLNMRRPPPSMP